MITYRPFISWTAGLGLSSGAARLALRWPRFVLRQYGTVTRMKRPEQLSQAQVHGQDRDR